MSAPSLAAHSTFLICIPTPHVAVHCVNKTNHHTFRSLINLLDDLYYFEASGLFSFFRSSVICFKPISDLGIVLVTVTGLRDVYNKGLFFVSYLSNYVHCYLMRTIGLRLVL